MELHGKATVVLDLQLIKSSFLISKWELLEDTEEDSGMSRSTLAPIFEDFWEPVILSSVAGSP